MTGDTAGDWKARFGARLGKAIEAAGGVPQFSRAVDIPERTLRNWIKGVAFPPTDKLFAMARAAGVDAAGLMEIDDAPATRPAAPVPPPPPPGVALIALVDARAAAGAGAWNMHTAEIERIPFPEAWLERLGGGRPDRCDFIRAIGDSMAPTIESGALMLIDRDQTTPPKGRRGRRGRDDDIFVFILGEDLRVKRVRVIGALPRGRVLGIASDNPDYDAEMLDVDDSARVKIIGRVIWWDNRL